MLFCKGVYVVSIEIGIENKLYWGVVNIGVKLIFYDFNKVEVVIEVNIFDFEDNIYGEWVIVNWYYFLCFEIKFDGIDLLVK